MDELERRRLTHPTYAEALTYPGVLCHYIASSTARLRDFAEWVEHGPGDLSGDLPLVAEVIAAVHDRLQPGCPDPVTAPPMPRHATWCPAAAPPPPHPPCVCVTGQVPGG